MFKFLKNRIETRKKADRHALYSFCLGLILCPGFFSQGFSQASSPFSCEGVFKQGGLLLCMGAPNQVFYITDKKILPPGLTPGKFQHFKSQKTFTTLFSGQTLLPIQANQKGVAIVGLHRTAPAYLFIISKENSTQELQKSGHKNSTSSHQKENRVIQSPDSEFMVKTYSIASRQYAIDRINDLPPRVVTPKTPKQIKKINQDWILKQKGFSSHLQADGFLSGFIAPAKGRISGVYGSQRILNGKPKNPHYGLDFAAPRGTPVIAPALGLVTLAKTGFYYEGGLVLIDHGQGLISAFLHMQSVAVQAGDWVKTGDLIGEIGAEGRATGSHLDWRVKWNKRQVDPAILLDMKHFLHKKQKTYALSSDLYPTRTEIAEGQKP